MNELVDTEAKADIIEKAVTKATYVSGSAAIMFGGLKISEICAIIGAVVTVSLAIFNVWFKMKYMRPDKRNKHKISDRRRSKRYEEKDETK